MKVWVLAICNVDGNCVPSVFSSKEKALVGSKEYYQEVIEGIEECGAEYDAKFHEKTGHWDITNFTENNQIGGEIYPIEVQ